MLTWQHTDKRADNFTSSNTICNKTIWNNRTFMVDSKQIWVVTKNHNLFGMALHGCIHAYKSILSSSVRSHLILHCISEVPHKRHSVKLVVLTSNSLTDSYRVTLYIKQLLLLVNNFPCCLYFTHTSILPSPLTLSLLPMCK